MKLTVKLFKSVMILVGIVMVCALPSFALDLGQAKAQGLVGETPSGYLAAVKPSSEVNQLVTDINTKRRAKYQEIAKKNGTPFATVEALAGQKAIDNTPPGQFIMSGGQWKKK